VNYFRAKAAAQFLNAFRSLAHAYWNALPQDQIDRLELAQGHERRETAESIKLHALLNERMPLAHAYARELRVETTVLVSPPPMFGGPVLPLDALLAITDEGPSPLMRLSRGIIFDFLNRLVGAATDEKQRAFRRLVIPIYWLVDIPAVLIRWPWLILEAAGLPRDIERSVVSNVLKVLLFLAYLILALIFVGNKLSPDLVRVLIPK
jgi:hypothetical protein